jgi:hypothetical protein
MLVEYEIITGAIHTTITCSVAGGICECISWVKLIYCPKSNTATRNVGNMKFQISKGSPIRSPYIIQSYNLGNSTELSHCNTYPQPLSDLSYRERKLLEKCC